MEKGTSVCGVSIILLEGKMDQISFTQSVPLETNSDQSVLDTSNGHGIYNASRISVSEQTGWRKWFGAFKHIFPLYIGICIASVAISIVSVYLVQSDYDTNHYPLSTLWSTWYRWDTGYYLTIATRGYVDHWHTAFFPFYPMLVRGLLFLHIIHNPVLAGLIVSNICILILFCVLFQLVKEDFDKGIADRTLLYLCVFPTACFLIAAYTEGTFLCLSVLSFYNMRRGHWWLAGIFGLCTSLCRSSGIFLLVPFCYEYLCQHDFNIKKIRFDVVSFVLIPLGVAIFSLYCYYRFNDFLAFSHAQSLWGRSLALPWAGIVKAAGFFLAHPSILDFESSRNVFNLIPDVLFLVCIILCFIGPWRLPRSHWSYAIYVLSVWAFLNLLPLTGDYPYPLGSITRFLIEFFPVFIFIAHLGKYRIIHYSYIFLCVPFLFYISINFLHGKWIV